MTLTARSPFVYFKIRALAPYLICVVCIMLNGMHSDKTGDRYWHVVLPLGITVRPFLLLSFSASLLSLSLADSRSLLFLLLFSQMVANIIAVSTLSTAGRYGQFSFLFCLFSMLARTRSQTDSISSLSLFPLSRHVPHARLLLLLLHRHPLLDHRIRLRIGRQASLRSQSHQRPVQHPQHLDLLPLQERSSVPRSLFGQPCRLRRSHLVRYRCSFREYFSLPPRFLSSRPRVSESNVALFISFYSQYLKRENAKIERGEDLGASGPTATQIAGGFKYPL